MFLTAKVHVVSGIIIGALAVMAMKQMCKTRETHKHSPVPAEPPERESRGCYDEDRQEISYWNLS